MRTTPRVASIEAILVDLPTVREHRLAMTTMTTQTLVIVRLRCDDGVEGVGEATSIGGLSYGEQSPEHYLVLDARAAIDEIATRVRARLEPLLGQARR